MAQTFSDAVLDEVQRLVAEEAATEMAILAAGNVVDYATYREKIGRLYAYRRVIEDLFPLAERNLEKR